MAGIAFFLSGTPAIASNISIEADGNWIKGHADHAPLGEVLSRLSDQTGCEIFVDEKLYDTPVTFDMPNRMPSEQAIRRMIHPYSNALVYEAVPGTDKIRIQQIKVFDEGGPVSRYVHAAGNGGQNVRTSYARGNGGARLSTLLSSKGVSSGEEAVRKNVRPALTVEKGALGIPKMKYRERGHGPDYRPSGLAMRKAYAKYRKERTAYDQRTQRAEMLNARQKAVTSQARYRAQRAQSLRHIFEISH